MGVGTQPPNGCFQKIWVPQNGWVYNGKLIKMDDLGVPLFFGNIQIVIRGAFADITQSSGAVAQWVGSLL